MELMPSSLLMIRQGLKALILKRETLGYGTLEKSDKNALPVVKKDFCKKT
jgi:hypothetical protein